MQNRNRAPRGKRPHEIFGFRTHNSMVSIMVVRDVEDMNGEKPSPQLKWRRTCITLPTN
jgi:hypothetical protein